jgi:hypothetical protein
LPAGAEGQDLCLAVVSESGHWGHQQEKRSLQGKAIAFVSGKRTVTPDLCYSGRCNTTAVRRYVCYEALISRQKVLSGRKTEEFATIMVTDGG